MRKGVCAAGRRVRKGGGKDAVESRRIHWDYHVMADCIIHHVIIVPVKARAILFSMLIATRITMHTATSSVATSAIAPTHRIRPTIAFDGLGCDGRTDAKRHAPRRPGQPNDIYIYIYIYHYYYYYYYCY